MLKNVVQIHTLIISVTLIKNAVKVLVVTLIASSAVMVHAATRQTVKSAKMALVSGPFRQICIKLMLKK